MESEKKIEERRLRVSFVGMLFAIVVATLAERFSDILSKLTGDWVSVVRMYESLAVNDFQMLPSLMHSFLALMMVSTSWVMWSRSQGGYGRGGISSLFSSHFVLLIVEVGLVILYFSLVKTIDFSVQSNGLERIENFNNSASPEAAIMVLVFLLFFIWDIIHDVLQSPREGDAPRTRIGKSIVFFEGVAVYCSISFGCLMASLLVLMLASSGASVAQILLYDVSLILILFLFNISKKVEFYSMKIFPGEESRKVTSRNEPMSGRDWCYISLLLLAYAVCLIAAGWMGKCAHA